MRSDDGGRGGVESKAARSGGLDFWKHSHPALLDFAVGELPLPCPPHLGLQPRDALLLRRLARVLGVFVQPRRRRQVRKPLRRIPAVVVPGGATAAAAAAARTIGDGDLAEFRLFLAADAVGKLPALRRRQQTLDGCALLVICNNKVTRSRGGRGSNLYTTPTHPRFHKDLHKTKRKPFLLRL